MGFLKKITDLFTGKKESSIKIREISPEAANNSGKQNASQKRHSKQKQSAQKDTDKTKKDSTTKSKPGDKPAPAKNAKPAAKAENGDKPKPARTTGRAKPAGPAKPAEGGEPKATAKAKPKPKAKPVDDRPFIEDYPADTWDAAAHTPPVIEGRAAFVELNLPASLLHAVHDIGFQYCTDIQAEILPHSLKGIDVTGKAQTGTGKTAAFLLTSLYRLMQKPQKPRKPGSPRVLIMAPTRELVIQIEKDAIELAKYTGARILSIFGGMDYEKQRDSLEEHVDIVIATPGRMLDYYKQRVIGLKNVEILVLDEADRMLDMGFLPDMRRIIDAVPGIDTRQTMLFSATLTPEILRLASMWTNNPIKVEIEPDQITSADVEQYAYIVSHQDKFTLLYNMLKTKNITKAMIFANRKDEVRNLVQKLTASGFSCGMLTGDVTQTRRIKTLENLRNGNINFLVATDVAGRGIHVEGVEVVFNYTLPDDPDDYVHRIGRTGRAGSKGLSIAFATEEDAYALPQIEEHIKEPLNYVTPDEELLAPIPEEIAEKIKKAKAEKRRQSGSRRGAGAGGGASGKRPRPPRGGSKSGAGKGAKR